MVERPWAMVEPPQVASKFHVVFYVFFDGFWSGLGILLGLLLGIKVAPNWSKIHTEGSQNVVLFKKMFSRIFTVFVFLN